MAETAAVAKRRPWSAILYVQVLIAIGIVLGYFWPDLAAKMKPRSDGFIELIRMIVA